MRAGASRARRSARRLSWTDAGEASATRLPVSSVTRTLVSRHFIRDVHEFRYRSFKEWAIYPEERRWDQLDDADEAGTMSTSTPLDELSFLFWLRTLPLEVGETYTRTWFSDEVPQKVLKSVTRVPAGGLTTTLELTEIRTP